ncbi:PEP-CTERM sorting domain-containing protein [Poriferisphaera corsica]|nr:PEP-CTERM sorting domain-containing protein [Poriferisphaera corsica]
MISYASAATLGAGETIFVDVQSGRENPDGSVYDFGDYTGVIGGVHYNDVPMYIDDGGTDTLTTAYVGTIVDGMVTSTGTVTDVDLVTREDFLNQTVEVVNLDGTVTVTDNLLYANGSNQGVSDSTSWFTDTAAKDMWQASGWDNNADQNEQNSVEVAFTGLVAGALYDLKTFHATKFSHSTTGNSRDFRVIANGIEVLDNAANGALVEFDSIAADQNGEIVVSVKGGDFYPNGTRNYIYLNAMSLSGVLIPEPASLALLGLGGLAMLRRRS